MRKSLLKAIFVVLLILTLCPATYAEDMKMSLGLKTWYNNWKIDPDKGSSDTSDYIALAGPSLKLSYGKYFGGISVMTSLPDYEFSTTDWSRTDVDAMVGYMVHPRFSILGGWKYLRGSTDDKTNKISHSAYGPAFGVSGNYPFAKLGVTAYSNAALMLLQGNYSSAAEDTSHDIIGYSVELGVAYGLWERLSVNLGYKYQNLEWKHVTKDILSGVNFGLTYSF